MLSYFRSYWLIIRKNGVYTWNTQDIWLNHYIFCGVCFLIYKSPWYFLSSFKAIGLLVQEKRRKIDFQDGGHSGHLGFPIRTIFAIFDLQVTQMFPTKFQINWSFGSGEKAKNRFSWWWPWQPSWISDRYNFSYIWSTSHSDAFYQVSSQLAQGCRQSRLLKLMLHNRWRMMHDGHWQITIAHFEHEVLRWVKSHILQVS